MSNGDDTQQLYLMRLGIRAMREQINMSLDEMAAQIERLLPAESETSLTEKYRKKNKDEYKHIVKQW